MPASTFISTALQMFEHAASWDARASSAGEHRLALCLRPHRQLDQGQEPSGTRREAGGGGRLGQAPTAMTTGRQNRIMIYGPEGRRQLRRRIQDGRVTRRWRSQFREPKTR